jgi:thiol-disulfide isomerase/thioredoxin
MRHFHLALAALLLLVIPATPSVALMPPSARTIDGAPFNPAGHVTIVHYWATWCAPCRAEMPILDSFYRKHRGQGLEMLAVSIDQGISNAKLKQHSGPFAFPVARVGDVSIARRDIPRAIPVTRIYDRTGRLIFESKADGKAHVDAATLERIAAPLLRR